MLLLVRHGESTWNAARRWAGQADPPLSARGQHQADALGTALIGAGISRVVASDQCRAIETAILAASHLGIDEIIEEPRIRERDCGVWSGLSHEQIESEFPGMLARWRRGEPVDFVGGEPADAFARRVTAGLATIDGAHADTEHTLVVAHAGVLRVVADDLDSDDLDSDGLDSDDLGITRRSSPNTGGLWIRYVDGRPRRATAFDPSAAGPTTSFGEVSDSPDTPLPATAEDGAAVLTDPSAATEADPVDLDAIERDLNAVDVALNRLADGTYWTDEVTGEPIPDHVLTHDPTARRA